jgi:hypothetical protein
MIVCLSRGDDAYPFAALGVNDRYKHALDHADRKKTVLAILLTHVLFDQRERIVKDAASRLEADFMTTKVERALRSSHSKSSPFIRVMAASSFRSHGRAGAGRFRPEKHRRER